MLTGVLKQADALVQVTKQMHKQISHTRTRLFVVSVAVFTDDTIAVNSHCATSAMGSIAIEIGYPRDVRFPPNGYCDIGPQQLRQSAEFYPIARELEGFRVGHQASGFIH